MPEQTRWALRKMYAECIQSSSSEDVRESDSDELYPPIANSIPTEIEATPPGEASGSSTEPLEATGGLVVPTKKGGGHSTRLTNFCFTCYPKNKSDLDKHMDWFRTKHGNPKYLIVAKEICPTTMKLHLQGSLSL